jgi:hypothetical protein
MILLFDCDGVVVKEGSFVSNFSELRKIKQSDLIDFFLQPKFEAAKTVGELAQAEITLRLIGADAEAIVQKKN